LNKQITLYLTQLLGGAATARVVFTPKPSGDYVPDIEVTASGGKLASGSDGQKDRIDAAIWLGFVALARRSAGTSSNILVLDEPGGFLDDGGKRLLVDILVGLVGESVSSVFLISHEPGFRTRVRRRWTVVRQGGVSHVEGIA
jgi:DNA repair exonuclease SbcCD ATPase subunit